MHINNTYAYGNTSSTMYYTGGLVGHGYYLYMNNSYSAIKNGEIFIRPFGGVNYDTLSNVLSPMYEYNQVGESFEDIIVAMSTVWNHDIWDFVNTDANGNPTLK